MKVLDWAGSTRRRPLTIAAMAAGLVFTALTAGPAAAANCQLGSNVISGESCASDANGDGAFDWAVSDTNGDYLLDTLALDTDFNGKLDTFYTTLGGFHGEVWVRYDTDGDGLYNDDEIGVYDTEPLLWDTDGDGYSDAVEITAGSLARDPFCTPYGCG